MTDHEGDSRDSEVMDDSLWPEAIFPDPLNPESLIVSLSPERLVIICFIIPP